MKPLAHHPTTGYFSLMTVFAVAKLLHLRDKLDYNKTWQQSGPEWQTDRRANIAGLCSSAVTSDKSATWSCSGRLREAASMKRGVLKPNTHSQIPKWSPHEHVHEMMLLLPPEASDLCPGCENKHFLFLTDSSKFKECGRPVSVGYRLYAVC